jgi:hypothetical protein
MFDGLSVGLSYNLSKPDESSKTAERLLKIASAIRVIACCRQKA